MSGDKVRSFLLGAVVAASCVACSTSGDPNRVPFSEDGVVSPTIPLTLIEAPTSTLEVAAQRAVDVHASWLCELQGQTFEDASDIAVALDDHLVRAGLDREGYDAFLSSLAGDQVLRDAVLFSYQEQCIGN